VESGLATLPTPAPELFADVSCGRHTDIMTTQADPSERKARKSVQFSEGATIVNSNGDVTESKEMNGGKESAENHSAGAGKMTDVPAAEQALTVGYRRRQRGRRGDRHVR
jgi:hypothetical protein